MGERFQRLLYLLRRSRHDADLRDEMETHRALRQAQLERDGLDAGEAARASRRAFGNATLAREDVRVLWIAPFDRLWLDLRGGFRLLLKTPALSVTAIASLALGIGANTAIFSICNEVLLRPLPVAEPTALVHLGAPGPQSGHTSCNTSGECDEIFSYPMYRDLAARQTALTGLAGHRLFRANVASDSGTLSGQGSLVSGNYFSVLGLAPALGRLIGSADDGTPDSAPVVVLSHAYWKTRFKEAPDVAGKLIIVNGGAMTVVGVAPKGFTGTTVGSPVDVFVPLTMRGRVEPPFHGFDDRQYYWIYAFGRLRPDVSIDQARTNLNGPYHAIINNVEIAAIKERDENFVAQFRAKILAVQPGAGQSDVQRNAGTPLTMLFGVTGILLLIACANIANLLLARSAAREAEIALRLSIGASRRQLVSQLLVESCVLAMIGGGAGVAVAAWSIRLIPSLALPEALFAVPAHLDMDVLLFSLTLAIGTGLLFGLFPALHATRHDLSLALKGQAGRSSGGPSAARSRAALVIAQIAMSMVLLMSAGLFLRSLANVSRFDLGISIDHVLTFRLPPRLNGYAPAAVHQLIERAEVALAAIPGVSSVSASTIPLIGGDVDSTNVTVEGYPHSPGGDDNSAYSEVGPHFFGTVGIPLLAGREFTASDTPGSPKVAVVNETFARRFNLGRDVVGRFMRRGSGQPDTEIVGFVRDSKYDDVKGDARPVFYTPYRQDAQLSQVTFYLRTSIDPGALLTAIPPVVAGLDPNLPVVDLRTMEAQLDRAMASDRSVTILATVFAVLAVLLAAIGLYGVLAYTVSQRTHEFGVRIALGADPDRLRRLVLAQVARMTGAGVIIGACLALFLGAYLQSLLFHIEGHDPLALLGAVVTLSGVAFFAGFLPARRAARVDPIRALRYD